MVQIVAGKGCVEQPTWFIIGDLIVIDFFSLFYYYLLLFRGIMIAKCEGDCLELPLITVPWIPAHLAAQTNLGSPFSS